MCEPATLTAMGTWAAANAGTIAAVSTVAGTALTLQQMGDANDRAKSMSEQQDAMASRQQEAINKTQVDSYAQLNRQGVEESQNHTMESQALQREMIARQSSARVAAAGAGVEGLSVDALLLDLSGKGLEAKTTAETNYLRTQQAGKDVGTQLQNRTTGELSRVQFGKGSTGISTAEYLGAGLRIGGAGVDYAKSKYGK